MRKVNYTQQIANLQEQLVGAVTDKLNESPVTILYINPKLPTERTVLTDSYFNNDLMEGVHTDHNMWFVTTYYGDTINIADLNLHDLNRLYELLFTSDVSVHKFPH